ncbi:hypothetical protein M514_10249 [Trichuris suis]|uniref:Uncharacterized protein n=1 Tax=Trichuris suis TaxID=68888 RepID=A0A085N9R8_9BILA|nr:hypothetical protein M513_10249 [Trichuris suis]KFD66214.1 hypothetical protein M514_10249 [Trichuris suis]
MSDCNKCLGDVADQGWDRHILAQFAWYCVAIVRCFGVFTMSFRDLFVTESDDDLWHASFACKKGLLQLQRKSRCGHDLMVIFARMSRYHIRTFEMHQFAGAGCLFKRGCHGTVRYTGMQAAALGVL